MDWGALLLRGIVFALLAFPVRAETATVAVATNFLTTASELAAAYGIESGHEIVVAHGSTGRLYAQIENGAPFDLFLSADTARTDWLVADGKAVDRMTYAFGKLVLVSRADLPYDVAAALADRRIALAEPSVAPFGAAALEVIESFGLDPEKLDLVYGDSVGQAAALFATGNTELGFLAASQLPLLEDTVAVLALKGRHQPIRQDAVLLRRGQDNPAAPGFFAFLGSEAARALIAGAGYGVPE